MSQTPNSIIREPFILEAGHLDTGEPLYIRGEVRAARGTEDTARPVVFISHGFKGFKDWSFFPYIAERFAGEGFFAVTFNYSCNGVNERDFDELDKFARNTYSREQEDLAVLLQALESGTLPLASFADPRRLYLLGHSKGGGGSIIFASEHPQVKAVVTWNGIASADLFDDAFKAQIAEHGIAYVTNVRTKQDMPIQASFYEDLSRNAERFDIVRRLAELKIPVLLVQGGQDSPRLKEGFERLRQAAPQHQILTIPSANHTFGAVHPFQGITEELETALKESIHFLKEIS
ncbi:MULTISPECIES: S9 family peptidase [Paenibacillus]|uniref:alpha/beta hydrolase family protein n=1 Tax=Paenibacillus TaxID=44249 RepID=UPI0006D04556|nr:MULTISPECIES: dienelactone hydrolase family protein [Paenibacillus]GCL71495.1 alpha/beta hydrolase [Paenibacillus naphthalenovorans]SDI83619.1 Dienelactone hydrolase family protein [Paenibacillus naphthalenovorans]